MNRPGPVIGEKFPVNFFIQEDIGTIIRFNVRSKVGQLKMGITGELRQIYYAGHEIHLNIIGLKHEYADLEEFSFTSGTLVDIVDPKEKGLYDYQ